MPYHLGLFAADVLHQHRLISISPVSPIKLKWGTVSILVGLSIGKWEGRDFIGGFFPTY